MNNNNSIKTYSDIMNEKAMDAEALELFNQLYEKLNSLSEKEIRFIAESVKTEETDVATAETINSDIEKMQNEGFIGGAAGLIGGLIAGDKLGKAICQALGITTGPLYSLLTSKIVTTAIATYLGIKM